MDIESYGYIVSKQQIDGADQQKDPGIEPEIDLDEERDPEVEEIVFEDDQEVDGSGNNEVPGPEILVDENVDDWDTEFEEYKRSFRPIKSLFHKFLRYIETYI